MERIAEDVRKLQDDVSELQQTVAAHEVQISTNTMMQVEMRGDVKLMLERQSRFDERLSAALGQTSPTNLPSVTRRDVGVGVGGGAIISILYFVIEYLASGRSG